MSDALELKYRPLSFDELVGWDLEKKSLLSIIGTKRTILLYGMRGCGKTTIARLIAYHLDIDDVDITEIDAATNTGIDDARVLKSSVSFFPIKGKYKIYIIDEVHRLSANAFDSLLKTLEEPPKHCYFVLCSSEINKIPETIKSRATKYEVKPLDDIQSMKLLDWICQEEKLSVSNYIKQTIIEKCEGIPREMVVSLDMVKDIKNDNEAAALLYTENKPQIIDLCRALIAKEDWKKVAAILQGITDEPESVRFAMMGYMNSVLMKDANPQAALVMLEFRDTFMYSKRPGLTLACFMALNRD
jgi:DNA polymerase-3 subunit gamma/tau